MGSVPIGCGVEISKRRFAPRLGLAYRATNKFVIRAGYGITNDPFPASELLRANYPVLIALGVTPPGGNDLLPAGSLAQGIPAITVPDYGDGVIDIPNNVGFQGLPKQFKRGYIQSWNFMLQGELGYGFTAQAGYVATRQVRQLGYLDINAGQVLGAGDAGRPLYAKFERIASTTFATPLSTSHYDSLQASLERRFSAGLQLAVNYTWSKSLGNVDNNDSAPNIQALPYFHLNRALTNYDRTHNLQITNIWELPFGKGKRWVSGGGVGSAILGGWQVNNFIGLMSGYPFTVYASGNMNLPGSTQTADQVNPTVAKLGGIGEGNPFYDPTAFADVTEARFGTSGFNSLRGPGWVNWDFGLFREFAITERFKLQFRLESFNFTNTPHFDNPDSDVTSDTFMVTESVLSLSREGLDERQFRFGLRLSF